MKITKIVLENYRQYANRQEIKFDVEETNKNVTIIIGENGEGKTNLLNAISWCLYGEEFRKKTKYKELPMITQVIKEEKEEFEKPSRIMVEITFSINGKTQGKYQDLVLMREASIINGDTVGSINFRGFLFSKEDPNPLELPDPTVFVSQNIPRDLREFFLFDGEQLEKYFLSTVGKTISKGIEKLARIDLLNESIRKLVEVKKGYVKEVAKTSPDIKQKEETIERIEKRISNDQESLLGKRDKLEESESKLNDIKREYEEIKAQDISEMVKERNSLEQERTRIDQQKQNYEKDLSNLLMIEGPIFLISPVFNRLRRLIDEKEETGEFPPDRKYIESLLERGRCICSQDLTGEDNVYRQSVEALHKNLTKQDLVRLAQIKYRKIVRTQSKIEDLPRKLSDLKRNSVQDIAELQKINSRLKDISGILKANPEEVVVALETTRTSLEKRVKEIQRDTWTLEEQIKTSKQDKERFERELNSEIAKEKRNELISKRITLCSDALNILKTTKVRIEQETMEKVNQKMKDYFKKVHWKDTETFDYIYLEKENGVSIKRHGREALGSLSAGEQNFLALAFIAAVREASGFDLPVIIDTPFGRIGEAARKNISRYLPGYLANSQITILATPSEYTGAVKKELNQYINKVVRLSYDKKYGITRIPSLEEI